MYLVSKEAKRVGKSRGDKSGTTTMKKLKHNILKDRGGGARRRGEVGARGASRAGSTIRVLSTISAIF